MNCVLISTLRVSGESFHIFKSRESGDILILQTTVVRSSPVEPTVTGSCYRGPRSYVASGVLGR